MPTPPPDEHAQRAAVIAHAISKIEEFLADDALTAEGVLQDIATMIEIRGLHVFETMPRLPPP